jgi:3-methyladenine DNA glycosylase AlkD
VTALATRADAAAEALIAELRALPRGDTPTLRTRRRGYTRAWKAEPAEFLIAVASALTQRRAYRWIGCELIRHHPQAFASLDDRIVARLANGLNSWDAVDAFGRILSGAAWAQGHISDALIERWTKSPDRWLRRAALVSTIGLNTPRDGGRGDTQRTFAICTQLAGDTDDMVQKAMSWALRESSKRDAAAVRAFIRQNRDVLAARVVREVTNKLSTGLKNPKGAVKH